MCQVLRKDSFRVIFLSTTNLVFWVDAFCLFLVLFFDDSPPKSLLLLLGGTTVLFLTEEDIEPLSEVKKAVQSSSERMPLYLHFSNMCANMD